MEQHLLNIEKTVSHSYLYLHKGIWKEESHEQRIMQQCQIPGTLLKEWWITFPISECISGIFSPFSSQFEIPS